LAHRVPSVGVKDSSKIWGAGVVAAGQPLDAGPDRMMFPALLTAMKRLFPNATSRHATVDAGVVDDHVIPSELHMDAPPPVGLLPETATHEHSP
jgi:hypothetical protein